MFFVIFVLFISTVSVHCVEEFTESMCTTPKGTVGECILIHDCEILQHIVKNKLRNDDEKEFLRNSTCGFMGKMPKICCPIITEISGVVPLKTCLASDGRMGKCQGSDDSIPQFKALTPTAPPNKCQTSLSVYPPDPKSKCCGIDSVYGDRIVGGSNAAIDQHPWLVILEYPFGQARRIGCGGALISGKYVLTAAHCVVENAFGKPEKVRLGEYDTSNEGPDCVLVEGELDCTTGAIRVDIEMMIPHPQFDPLDRRKPNDIALIRMTEMAPYTYYIRPICLPTLDVTSAPPKNLTLFVAGFGATSSQNSSSTVKKYVELPYVDQSACQTAYKAPGLRLELWQNQLCAGGEKGKDSCKGDSGGPLMYEHGRTYEIAGLVSFGPMSCGTEDVPGVYTKVFEYKEWIGSNIQP